MTISARRLRKEYERKLRWANIEAEDKIWRDQQVQREAERRAEKASEMAVMTMMMATLRVTMMRCMRMRTGKMMRRRIGEGGIHYFYKVCSCSFI